MFQLKIVVNCGACESYISKCIASLRSQTFRNWRAYVTVDPCGDGTLTAALAASGDDERISVRVNASRRYSLANLITAIESAECGGEDVIVVLDGDDWFLLDNALQVIADTYERFDCWMTYGSWISNVEGKEKNPDGRWPAYPSGTIDFRNYKWLASHVRTWKKWLWDRIDDRDLRDMNGEYFRTTTDQAVMLPMLEMSGTAKARHIPWPLLVFNRKDRGRGSGEMINEARMNQRWLRSRPPYRRIERPRIGIESGGAILSRPPLGAGLAPLAADLAGVVSGEYPSSPEMLELFRAFLGLPDYDRSFCVELLSIARGRTGASWEMRRTAVLMLERQLLNLRESEQSEYFFAFDLLGIADTAARSIPGFRRKLARLDRVHRGIAGMETAPEALRDFIRCSAKECKLALARYVFHPREVVARILGQVEVSDGRLDGGGAENAWAEAAPERILLDPLAYEREILELLCADSSVYWVSANTSSELNALVEYPHTSAVLVIKPPGSDREFEIKRAGMRGGPPLTILFARNGKPVPHTHRLQGGNRKSLCWTEAESATRLARVWKIVHGADPPVSQTLSMATVFTVPAIPGNAQILDYFTEPNVFGAGYREMRSAMRDSVKAYDGNEPSSLSLALKGDLGLTIRFMQHMAPTQAILGGTSSYRLDLVDKYLSSEGPDLYFTQGLRAAYDLHDMRRFAGEVLDEVLGVYTPPRTKWQSWEMYLDLAFHSAENRERANQAYLSLLAQAGTLWGTLMGTGGFSDGESFVARNMGIKTRWIDGNWTVRLVCMDHDNLSLPGSRTREFHPRRALSGMERDERYLLGTPREGAGKSSIACLQSIYRVVPAVIEEGERRFRNALECSYRKTLEAGAQPGKMREYISPAVIQQFWDWNQFVGNYLISQKLPGEEERAHLIGKGYSPELAAEFVEVVGVRADFLGRYPPLFDLKYLDFIRS